MEHDQKVDASGTYPATHMSATDKSHNTLSYEDGVPPYDNELGNAHHDELQQGVVRGMHSRHISMISIGGTIGTGLFIASGKTLAGAGPLGALIAYAFMGITVWCIMTSLGEMATLIPVTGSFNHYAGRFIDPALGFALGWNYWISWGVTIAAELAAAGVIISFWKEVMPVFVWSLILLGVITIFNMFGGRGYGETEYWLSLIKIITVIVFIIVGVIVAAGGVGGHTYGFENWNNPGYFVADETTVDPTTGDSNTTGLGNHFYDIANTMINVGFSYMGTELVGIAAGETANPRKAVPRAIRNVFWRILLFFLGSIFVMGLIIPWNDQRLLDAAAANSDAGSGVTSDGALATLAPFTLVFVIANIKGAAQIMNVVLLTVVISASNSALYCGSRTLMAMAREGKAPRIFGWVNKWGVPVPAVALTACFGLIVTAASVYSSTEVLLWVISLSSVSGFISWAGIGWTHWRFRAAYIAQGRDLNALPYRAWEFPFSGRLRHTQSRDLRQSGAPLTASDRLRVSHEIPIASIFGAVVCTIITITAGFASFIPVWNTVGFFQAYITLIIFVVLWVGYKVIMKTKMVPLLECDFDTGVRWADIGQEQRDYVKRPRTPMGLLKSCFSQFIG
ncbi:hypothetical protein HKX48_001689 [Thoreauomyces humboldtii]|nr:hypothetical protein HKX48_001689 [Thoreauomyces humboldtii]